MSAGNVSLSVSHVTDNIIPLLFSGSGIWGIFYFKEVTKPKIICKWFLSATVTIVGILLLGYESSPAGPGR